MLLNPEGGGVGIGTVGAISPGCALEVKVDAAGDPRAVLLPKMTTAQRDNIPSPTAGMVIYNTSTSVLNFYNGAAWGAV